MKGVHRLKAEAGFGHGGFKLFLEVFNGLVVGALPGKWVGSERRAPLPSAPFEGHGLVGEGAVSD